MLIKTPAHTPMGRHTLHNALPMLKHQPSSQLPSTPPKAKGHRLESD